MAGWTDRIKASFNVLRYGFSTYTYQKLIASENFQDLLIRDSTETVLAPIRNRLSIDASMNSIRHVRLDDDGYYLDDILSELNQRLTIQANIDQSGPMFIQDAVEKMLENGVVAIVPIETTEDPRTTSAYDILSLRAGVVKEWYTKHVEIEVFNENSGQRDTVILPKSFVALAYNPLYTVMNRVNSTLRRLVEKLALSDLSDNKLKAPNLDLILQMPFSIKNDKLEKEADKRIASLEAQLYKSPYGVAYVGSTEKITQLNRPVTNVLGEQIQWLTDNLYSQLGLTPAVFSGTAPIEEVVAYYNRTVSPILLSLTSAMTMTFLTRTAIKQKQSIMPFQNLFKMVPLSELAEAADKFTRNEIMSSNEVRQRVGLKPRKDDPKNDELRNKNLNEKGVTNTSEVNNAETK